MDRINLNDFVYVLALLRGGTLTRAGEILDVNYTTVARNIKKIEEFANVKLFKEGNGRYVPTELTCLLMSDLEQMEETFKNLKDKLAKFHKANNEKIVITCPSSVAQYLVLPLFDEFRKIYPGIELVISGNSDLVDLNCGSADIALRVTNDPPENLIGYKVGTITRAVYCSQHYYNNHFTAKDVALTILSPLKTDSEVEEALNIKGSVGPNYINLDGMKIMQTSIEAGLGIGALPCYIGDNMPGLVKIPDSNLKTEYDFWILNHPADKKSSSLKNFKSFFIDKMRTKRDLFVK